MEQRDRQNLRVLIVEDESLIAMLIEDTLSDLDYDVAGVAGSLPDALAKAQGLEFDVAILDMNLNGEPATAVAEVLIQRAIPFMFSTGYGVAGVPDAFKNIPVLQKPFNDAEFRRTIEAAMNPCASRDVVRAGSSDRRPHQI